ncbi:hypothetical protein [Fodinibius halophilus]|uniref:Uncharacterized protein n=1 Tax=Fodinibius halophilus TaxID=1736908 RepID=A0A6M1T5Q7_9BACT|nr:hypothetical protein [Fodinibius halophilus]NGP87983.1 hypothetical protein [Fodinibius halophilus]
MGKKKKQEPKGKQMSEGQAIAVTVLLIAVVIIAVIFGIQYLVDVLFPNW